MKCYSTTRIIDNVGGGQKTKGNKTDGGDYTARNVAWQCPTDTMSALSQKLSNINKQLDKMLELCEICQVGPQPLTRRYLINIGI